MDDCHLAAAGLMIWRSEGRIPQGRVTVQGRVLDLLPFDGELLLLYTGCCSCPPLPPCPHCAGVPLSCLAVLSLLRLVALLLPLLSSRHFLSHLKQTA